MVDTMTSNVVRFRTAWSGFNRQDVTEYLSRMSVTHREAMTELNNEVLRLEKENEELRCGGADVTYVRALEERNAELEEKLCQLEARLAEISAGQERNADAVREPEKAETVTVENAADLMQKELEAYRRAEAVERRANQRARQLGGQIGVVSGDMVEQLNVALTSAKAVLAAMGEQIETLNRISLDLDAAMTAGMGKVNAITDALTCEEETE